MPAKPSHTEPTARTVPPPKAQITRRGLVLGGLSVASGLSVGLGGVAGGLGLTGCAGQPVARLLKTPPHGAVSTRPPAAPEPAPEPLPRYGERVVIIGAGLAGLTAARNLLGAGCEVTLLEATVRPGGRIQTLRAPFSAGQHVELGAGHLVGDPELLKLVDASGAELYSVKQVAGPTRWATFVNGERKVFERGEGPPPALSMSEAESRLEFAEQLTHYFAAVRGKTPQQLGWDSGLTALDNISAADYLRAQGATPAFVRFIEETLVPGDSAELSSALSIMRDAASFRREMELPGKLRIRGGMDRLTEGLAKLVEGAVRYSAPVTRVRQDEQGVQIRYTQAGAEVDLEADQLICALPYTALAQLDLPHNRAEHPVPFYFSAEKTQAIQTARMAAVLRVWLQTKSRLWLARGETGRVETDLWIGAVRDETEQPGKPGILGAYLTGRLARRFCPRNVAKIEKLALRQLEQAQPGVNAAKLAFAYKCWDADPYARGGYSWFGVGELTRAGVKYASREGRIHFAGDHVSSRPGFMHGAVESALRVAQDVKRLV